MLVWGHHAGWRWHPGCRWHSGWRWNPGYRWRWHAGCIRRIKVGFMAGWGVLKHGVPRIRVPGRHSGRHAPYWWQVVGSATVLDRWMHSRGKRGWGRRVLRRFVGHREVMEHGFSFLWLGLHRHGGSRPGGLARQVARGLGDRCYRGSGAGNKVWKGKGACVWLHTGVIFIYSIMPPTLPCPPPPGHALHSPTIEHSHHFSSPCQAPKSHVTARTQRARASRTPWSGACACGPLASTCAPSAPSPGPPPGAWPSPPGSCSSPPGPSTGNGTRRARMGAWVGGRCR